jgi:hypothetical protein
VRALFSAEVYDPATNTWLLIGGIRDHLVAGGASGSGLTNTAELFTEAPWPRLRNR